MRIKTSLDGTSLKDSFDKVASVKRLRRHVVHDFMPHPTTGAPIPLYRNYLSARRDEIIQVDEAKRSEESLQIFAFVLAGESRVKHETLLERFGELAAQLGEELSPNLLVTLDEFAIRWGNIEKGERKEIRPVRRWHVRCDHLQGRAADLEGKVVGGDRDALGRIEEI